jgi:cation-transporting ATPase 13A2
VKQKLFNLRRLHELAGATHPLLPYNNETKKRGTMPIMDCALVPGDCFVVTQGMTIPCDAVLIQGRVVVDESMLTGESVPVTKSEYVYSEVDNNATKRVSNILYSGTNVKMVAPDKEAVAIAYRTGFRSAKGELISALIQPQQDIVQFLPDAMLAIAFMVIITTAIFGWSADQLKELNTSDYYIGIAYLTALTIAVPPGLVACLSIGTSLSVARLLLKNIGIADTGKLNAAGYISYACFDKTGTLTDENIVFQGVKVFDKNDSTVIAEGFTVNPAFEKLNIANRVQRQIVYEVMATCHNLSLLTLDATHASKDIEDSDGNAEHDTWGKIVGDPLEVELFRVSGWAIGSSHDRKYTTATPPDSQANGGLVYTIYKQFEFTPDKLRAATLIQRPGALHAGFESKGEPLLLVKGSPEMIAKLADPLSVPATLNQELTSLTKQGYRVLAVGYKTFDEPLESLLPKSQEELESNLTFLGLIYFSNKLKKDTYPATIQCLVDANVHVNMITGDHFHTAAAISYECNILNRRFPVFLVDGVHNSDHQLKPVILDATTDTVLENTTLTGLIDDYYTNLHNATSNPTINTETENPAVSVNNNIQLVFTGIGFQAVSQCYPELLEPLCRIAKVFARMKPADKKTVVDQLMKPHSKAHLLPGYYDEIRSYHILDMYRSYSAKSGALNTKPCHVLFCGDGANDMEALSHATVGVSLVRPPILSQTCFSGLTRRNCTTVCSVILLPLLQLLSYPRCNPLSQWWMC